MWRDITKEMCAEHELVVGNTLLNKIIQKYTLNHGYEQCCEEFNVCLVAGMEMSSTVVPLYTGKGGKYECSA